MTKVIYISINFRSINIPVRTNLKISTAISATDGGSIIIGNNVSFGRNSKCCARGGLITIGNNVHIGDGVVIVAINNIFIGTDTLIAEYVVIRDQDHRVDSHPISSSGFESAPVYIGRNVWIGCKASVLRGAEIGDRSVIGAHALVRSIIPEDTLAVGVPARVVKKLKAVQ